MFYDKIEVPIAFEGSWFPEGLVIKNFVMRDNRDIRRFNGKTKVLCQKSLVTVQLLSSDVTGFAKRLFLRETAPLLHVM